MYYHPSVIGRRRSALGLNLLWTTLATSAWGEDARQPKPEIGFSADELEGDLRVGELSLRGNVVVTYDRFRLTSPELTLARTARGIGIHGWGELVFCPCPNPPVSIGFSGVLVGPPADLMVERPELRVAGTTLLVLPWFWLRAPSRPGLLPPTVAWRGADGLLLGAGVHLPWRGAPIEGESSPNALDLTGAGYVEGGFEITGRLRTARSTNRVRWDRLRGDLLAVDAHGSQPAEGTGAVAWDVDAVRGSRARSAAPSLEEAARAFDRAAAEATVRPTDDALLGFGFRAIGPRGGFGTSERGASGPRATLAVGNAVGSVGAWDVLSTFTALADPWLGATELGRVEGGIDITLRPSVLLARIGVREELTAGMTSPDGAAASKGATDALAVAELELAAPLARTFVTGDGANPEEESPFVHIIEPRARVSAAASHTSGAFWSASGRPMALASGEVLVASLGARTTWGRMLTRSGGALEVDIGEVGTGTDEAFSAPATVVRYRTSWSSEYLGWAGEGALRLFRERGQVAVGRVRVGEQDGWHLALRTAGRAGIEPIVARVLAPADAAEPSGGWFSDEGWSVGGEVRAKLGQAVAATIAVDEDLTSRALLATRASVGYAHPCRCISVDAFAAHRLGRGGIDVWVSIDLAPR
jgi:hypothetical protein